MTVRVKILICVESLNVILDIHWRQFAGDTQCHIFMLNTERFNDFPSFL